MNTILKRSAIIFLGMSHTVKLLPAFLLVIVNFCTAQKIDFDFNFDNAKETIAILKEKNTSEAQLQAFTKLPGTQAVIKKIKANDLLAADAIKNAANGVFPKNSRNFQYEMIAGNLTEWENFINLVISKQDSIKDVLRKSFSPFLDKTKSYQFNIYFLMGSYSMGFTFGGSDAFYVGLHRYKFDLQAVILTCKHELFHNIQNMYYDAEKTAERLGKIGKGYENTQSLLNYLFKEGAATYIEEYKLLKNKNTSFLRELKGQSAVNDYRINSLNLLVNTILLNAFNHPESAGFNDCYELLFDWNWNNPAYYVGEKMTEALTEVKGKEILLDYLKKDAVYFFIDYIELAKTNKEKYPIRFSAEFTEMANKIKTQIELVNNK